MAGDGAWGRTVTLPYSGATSGEKAIKELRKIMEGFGCAKFGTMTDTENQELIVQFEYRGRQVQVKASARGYAAAFLKENPWSERRYSSRVEWERRALKQANIAIYSILRDWIKGQVTAIETGILTFEGAFLGQILLGSGKTVLETVEVQGLLPAPTEEKITRLAAAK